MGSAGEGTGPRQSAIERSVTTSLVDGASSTAAGCSGCIEALLTVKEVAALLKVKPKSVYAIVEAGLLPGVRRIGRRLRFYRPELVAWMAGQESARPRRSR